MLRSDQFRRWFDAATTILTPEEHKAFREYQKAVELEKKNAAATENPTIDEIDEEDDEEEEEISAALPTTADSAVTRTEAARNVWPIFNSEATRNAAALNIQNLQSFKANF